MNYTDVSNPNSHPFVTKCYRMATFDLRDYHEILVAKFNRLYEKAYESDGCPFESRAWQHAEETEEQANIAFEILDIRDSR